MPSRTWEQYEQFLVQRWPLTLREVQIIVECLKGRSNKQAGRVLGISHETVNKTLDKAYAVIGVHGKDELAARLLIADIDNTPFHQAINLVRVGAYQVNHGFLGTLRAARSEHSKPRRSA